MRVLLVEDNPLTAKGLTYLLEREGFVVVTAGTVAQAREVMGKWRYDLALLDVGLTDGDGYEVARQLKGLLPEVAIVFLTAHDDEASAVRGLGLGDDYVTKPFRNRELVARIRAVLRRQGRLMEVLKCGDLTLDIGAGVLRRGETEVNLSALEYKIVYLLMQNAGVTVPRERLLDEIWDFAGNVVNDNTLTVYIKRIREKIGEDVIATVKGIGYRM